MLDDIIAAAAKAKADEEAKKKAAAEGNESIIVYSCISVFWDQSHHDTAKVTMLN